MLYEVITLNGQFGYKIYNNTANAFFYAGNLAIGRNVPRYIVGNGEAPVNTADPSTRFLEDGSFVRLQDFTLGYNIPVTVITSYSIHYTKLYDSYATVWLNGEGPIWFCFVKVQ